MALAASTHATAPATATATPFARAAGSPFAVERVSARAMLALEADIRALEARALEPNVFAGAEFLLAACRHLPDDLAPAFLTIRDSRRGPGDTLVGLLAVRQQADRAFGLLRGWEHPLQASGSVLVDRKQAVPVFVALITHLGAGLGRDGLCLPRMPVSGAMAQALQQAGVETGAAVNFLSTHARAVLHLPGAARWNRDRRRQKRRLGKAGTFALRIARDPIEVRRAFETFLALEASSWKGRNGTALLSDAAETNLGRAMVWTAARHGKALIAELVVDETVIASVVALAQGNLLCLWKIAHDEAYARHAPGALALLELSDWAARDGRFALLDSCSMPGSAVIEQIWDERRSIGDAIIQVTADAGAYQATLARERMRRSLRERVKIIYRRLQAFRAA